MVWTAAHLSSVSSAALNRDARFFTEASAMTDGDVGVLAGQRPRAAGVELDQTRVEGLEERLQLHKLVSGHNNLGVLHLAALGAFCRSCNLVRHDVQQLIRPDGLEAARQRQGPAAPMSGVRERDGVAVLDQASVMRCTKAPPRGKPSAAASPLLRVVTSDNPVPIISSRQPLHLTSHGVDGAARNAAASSPPSKS